MSYQIRITTTTGYSSSTMWNINGRVHTVDIETGADPFARTTMTTIAVLDSGKLVAYNSNDLLATDAIDEPASIALSALIQGF